jgi:hypothetical protein
MALQRFSASSSSYGGSSASSTGSASASEDDEPPAKKAKGLEGPDSMRNLSWNQLQSMDAEEPGILSNLCSSGMLCVVFHWDTAVIFICLGSCWK